MEFSAEKIAALVLGYLKNENCTSAVAEYLSTSPVLKDVPRKEFIITRVFDRTLVDILMEYAEIYTIIHQRLETTDYYKRNHKGLSLDDKLLYILDNDKKICGTPVRQRSPFCKKPRSSDIGTNTEFNDSNSFDVNTTPAEALPGNSKPDYTCATPINKKHSDEENSEGETPCVDVEILKQTLLDHHELIEKLADNINTVCNTPNTSFSSGGKLDASGENESTASQDIDKAIKTIVQKTTSDPSFDKIIEEIIGTATATEESASSSKSCTPNDNNKSTETASPSVLQGTIADTPNNVESRNLSTTEKSEENINQTPVTQRVPDVSAHETNQQTPHKPTNNDVILFDGSLDKYLKFNKTTRTVANTTSSQAISCGSLLMVQPQIAAQNQNPYFVINTAESTNVHVPVQQNVNFGGVNLIDNQDIMSMPTVIVCDDGPQPIVAHSCPNSQLPQNAVVSFGSMATLTAPDNIHSSVVPQESEPDTSSVAPKTKQSPKKRVKVLKPRYIAPKPNLDVPISLEQSATIIKDVIVAATPMQPLSGSKKQTTTPRSGSHVRALDFSTPFNAMVTTEITGDVSLVQNKDCNKTNISQVTKSLFAVEKAEQSNKEHKAVKALEWDTALRETIKSEDEKCKSPKKKAAVRTKSKKNIQAEMNRTQEDGKSIEKALLEVTPQKSEGKAQDIKAASRKSMSKKKTNKRTPKKTNSKTTKLEQSDACTNSNILKKETVYTKINEIKELGFTEDGSNKLILSPSKLNASKRSLIDSTDGSCKKITLEISKTSTQALSAKRNIVPALETPVKEDLVTKPVSYFSPVNVTDTPFTRVLKEQLHGIDLSTINTPKFPVTPSFPLTPNLSELHYENRPTDYSSSSSYYLPSDNEQNKSLETLMGECKRLEEKPSTPGKTIQTQNRIQILEEVRIPPPHMIEEQERDKIIAEKVKAMKHNVVGRKNLNLVKPAEDDISSETSSDSSSTSSSSEDGEEWGDKNNTVVEKPIERRYSLRARNSSAKVKQPPENISEILSSVEIKNTLEETNKTSSEYREKILAEMEEKKKRTIAVLNDSSKTTLKQTKKSNGNVSKKNQSDSNRENSKLPQRLPNGQFRKKDNPKKPRGKVQKISPECSSGVVLHISSDDDNPEPFEIVETELRSSSASNTPVPDDKKKSFDISVQSFQKAYALAKEKTEQRCIETGSDQEAEELVKGLKQWGIHLVHNKSPKTGSNRIGKRTAKLPSEKKNESLEEGEIQSESDSDKSGGKATKSKTPSPIKRDISKNKADKHAGAEIVTNTNTIGECAEIDNRKPETITETKTIKECDFDLYLNHTETLNLVYDPVTASKKKLSEYDFSILSKKINATVYIEELDVEEVRYMTFTPFEFILEISENKLIQRRRKSVKESLSAGKKVKPLNLLYKALVQETNKNTDHISPLESLYESKKTSYNKHTTENKVKCSPTKKKVNEKYQNSLSSLSKPGRVKERRKSQTAQLSNKDDQMTEKEAQTDSRDENCIISECVENNKQELNDVNKAANSLSVVDGVIMLNAVSYEEGTEADPENDLMNYAIAGTPDKSTKKRPGDTLEDNQREKKTKTEEGELLLKKIDVDTFLKQLHGDK